MAGPLDRLPFREIYVVDFEFVSTPGERPDPVCMVARELRGGRLVRLWCDMSKARPAPPFGTGPDVLFVAHYAPADLGCFLALGWPLPARILDTCTEFRNTINGRPGPPGGATLLGAASWYGVRAGAADWKGAWRERIMQGPPFTREERVGILDYCQADVDVAAAVLVRMLPDIFARKRDPATAFRHALYRGRYTAAAARMEWTGVPIDSGTLGLIRDGWGDIKAELISEVDSRFGVYEDGHFRRHLFEGFLKATGLTWPRRPSGILALDGDTFRDMAKAYPGLEPLRELRHALGEFRSEGLQVGRDGRNRAMLSVFRSKTSRNQPSNTKFVFGPAKWMRGLIKPDVGRALAHVDFASQEIGIAAALSGDAALLRAYQSGDVYLAFAKEAGLAPEDASKASHKAVRDQCKAVVLGTLYGMGPQTLATRIGRHRYEARALLDLHRQTYPRFWRWSDDTVTSAFLNGRIETGFGWKLSVGDRSSPRTLANFPMQSNGAEIMRLTASLATERGISVCAPIHDAFLIEAPSGEIDGAVAALQACMREASSIVLGGFELGSDAETIRYPHRFMDERGALMWATVTHLLDQIGQKAICA